MFRRTTYMCLLTVGLLIGAAGCGGGGDQTGDTAAGPAVAFQDLDGTATSLADYRGKVVMVDIWATWCAPCRIEIPHLMELYRKHRDKDFALVGISIDEAGTEVVQEFARELDINYPLWWAPASAVTRQFGPVRGLPTTFLLDREGTVQKTYVGYRPGLELQMEKDILALLDSDALAAKR